MIFHCHWTQKNGAICWSTFWFLANLMVYTLTNKIFISSFQGKRSMVNCLCSCLFRLPCSLFFSLLARLAAAMQVEQATGTGPATAQDEEATGAGPVAGLRCRRASRRCGREHSAFGHQRGEHAGGQPQLRPAVPLDPRHRLRPPRGRFPRELLDGGHLPATR